MKSEVYDFIEDQFTDFKGETRKFIVAAVSTPVESTDNIKKCLSIGFAVCCPEDMQSYNVEIGKKIAISRAKSGDYKLFSTQAGMINTKMVRALMEQEIIYFKNNPESHIPGYSRAQATYDKKQKQATELQEMEASLTEEEKLAYLKLQFLNNESFKKLVKMYILRND